MSAGTVRRVSRQDIQLVQNLIERCLQLYMNEKEVVETLLAQAKIEPGFTELVWQKLEEENREFFQAYYLRLRVKHQILEFNKLLEQQVQLMRQVYPTGVSSLPTTNGNHISHLQQSSSSYNNSEQEKIQHSLGSTLPNPYLNGGSSLHNMHHPAMGMSVRASRVVDPLPNMISSQSSDMGLMQGLNLNDGTVKTEVGYSGGSAYMFGADNSVLEARSTMGDASIGSFNTVESTSQTLNDSILDADTNSFGFLDQIPRNLSLSDLTAFSQTSDILEGYARSPFLATDGDHFLDVSERGEQGEDSRIDLISERLSYEDFGSE